MKNIYGIERVAFFIVVLLADNFGDVLVCDPPILPPFTVQSSPVEDFYSKKASIHYKCEEGYDFEDGNSQHKIGCSNDGWQPKNFWKCLDKCGNKCGINGKCQTTLINGKETPICQCEKNYAGEKCSTKVCEIPPTKEHGTFQVIFGSNRSGHFEHGTQIHYKCEAGYEITKGNTRALCQLSVDDGTVVIGWSPKEVPRCEAVSCPEKSIKHGNIYPMKLKYSVGDTISVSCYKGFKLSYKHSDRITCGGNGYWLPVWPECEEIKCPNPLPIANGLREITQKVFTVGSHVRYSCNFGFALVGHSRRNCIELSGEAVWDKSQPTCLSLSQLTQECALRGKQLLRKNGKYICGTFATNRPIVLLNSKSNSAKPLTIVTATAGGLLLLLLLLITMVAIQRRRLARNGNRNGSNRGNDDRYAFLYYSNDFHLVLPSYDEAIQGRRPQPPPYQSNVGNSNSVTVNTVESRSLGIENPLAVSGNLLEEPSYETTGEPLHARINFNEQSQSNANRSSCNLLENGEVITAPNDYCNEAESSTPKQNENDNKEAGTSTNTNSSTDEPLYALVNRVQNSQKEIKEYNLNRNSKKEEVIEDDANGEVKINYDELDNISIDTDTTDDYSPLL